MQQILFQIPIINVPIYGYGFMLFCAFIACTWLAVRLSRREGYPKEPIQDLTVWLFVFGIIGARCTFIAQNWDKFKNDLLACFAVWDGGLVFYGSIFGALVGYALAYHFQLKKHGVSHLKLADIVAPCLALGLCLGRVGCLLNGCCFGDVACGNCMAISFPLSEPAFEMAKRGNQTAAGFVTAHKTDFLTLEATRTVSAVEPHSPADNAGLKPGDTIEQVWIAQGQPPIPIKMPSQLETVVGPSRPREARGEHWVEFEVTGTNGAARKVGPFAPRSLGVHPTQIYESISMALLLFLLVSYYPYKKRDGSLMVLIMLGYGVHRFLNEMLRTDNEIAWFGMTFSQNISVGVLIAAAILALLVWRRPPLAMATLTPPTVSTISN